MDAVPRSDRPKLSAPSTKRERVDSTADSVSTYCLARVLRAGTGDRLGPF
jgi:hypothetical protein